ncbi:hypothetical protein AAIA71_29105 (plasmid) [Vibrio harveyi]|uniref:hypothetical protein n=1 Tax=Vibrio harveyi TaxID=669 RepID=UPI0012DB6E86|nr:hypothetical protein [Vibrio harveyi]ELI6430206.1 hypothetical protein [Vibrio harveyi]
MFAGTDCHIELCSIFVASVIARGAQRRNEPSKARTPVDKEARSKKQEARSKKQEARSKKQEARSKKQEARSKKQEILPIPEKHEIRN